MTARRWLVVLSCTALVLLAVAGIGFKRVQQAMTESRVKMTALRATLSDDQPERNRDAAGRSSTTDVVSQLCVQAQELGTSLAPELGFVGMAAPLTQLVSQLPDVGNRAAGNLTLAASGGEVLRAGRLVCTALGRVLDVQAAGGDVSAQVAALAAGRGDLRQAVTRLRGVQTQLSKVETYGLDQSASDLYVLLRDRLPQATRQLTLLAELPEILGSDGRRSYLLLSQNSDELRPTGGFIGTAGLLTFESGRLIGRSYGSSYAFNLPPSLLVPPPAPLERYMGAGYWQLQESNWAPDFPTAARQARFFYEQIPGRPPLAGIVAIDQELVVQLLQITGPVAVPEFDEIVTAENARERLDYQVHLRLQDGPDQDRKVFVSALFNALIERLGTNTDGDGLRLLVSAFERALNAQHLQVWLSNDDAEQALSAIGGDGRLLATDGDALMVVSANLGRNKINRDVDEELTYTVFEDEAGRLAGQVNLRLHNRHPDTDPDPYATAAYIDFLRLYVPSGSELLSTSGLLDPAAESECGRTVLLGQVVVPPDETRAVQVRYRLPARLTRAGYSLLIQKQAGAAPAALRVDAFGAERVLAGALNSHRALTSTGGELRASTWGEVVRPAAGTPACDVRTDPPRFLSAPTQLSIPRIGVQAEIVELGVQPDGTLAAPSNGSVVGWYGQSARPGQVGNLIVSGHIDWEKRLAVFARLADLKPGDRVEMGAEDGQRFSYEVEWTRLYDVINAPLREIIGPTSQRWLTLITCGGTFDSRTHDYSHRAVVRARLVEGSL